MWQESLIYQYILTGIVVGVCSITDLRYRIIYKKLSIIYLILVLAGHFISGNDFVSEILPGILPGIFCFFISWISRQGLGYGDSVLITICGISLGIWDCVGVIFTAFLCSGIWAVILMKRKKAERDSEFPFVPFLFLGVVVQGAGGLI